MARALTAVLLLLLMNVELGAQASLPPILRAVRFDQRLNEQVSLDLAFRDEAERTVRLRDFFHSKKPVILNLAYFRCPMLCDQVMNGMVRALLDTPLEVGKDFEILTVSFDARETPEMARAKKTSYVQRYGRDEAASGWHFLTGDEDAIKKLTSAVGFHFTYDPCNDQFAHASGIVLLTPEGKVSRYFYDVRYSPRDLRLGLVEASANHIGSAADQVLLFCFHYDPADGRYGVAVMNLVRAGGVLTLLALGTFMTLMLRRERRRAIS